MILAEPYLSTKQTKHADQVIEIKNLHKSFGKNAVLKGIDISVEKGENLVILGKSGSGKSVLIKCLVRLITPDEGEISVLGTSIEGLNYAALNALRIKVGFLFQTAALYDSMTVAENLAFPLKRHFKNISEKECEDKIKAVLEDVGLIEAIDKMPAELSGGMRKRIGLARTLILEPEIVLYDEPTTGLDTITSHEISELIVDIQQKRKTTAIIITHDMACARLTSDRIAVLNEGVIHAEGTYNDLEQSKDKWIKSFFNV
jgi:phospholipid/cholesterol/gamma-HCH transport system ATP-binding protein